MENYLALSVRGYHRSYRLTSALGFDLTDDLSFELKALKVVQDNLEFPGLYFDARSLDTEAYAARITYSSNSAQLR